MALAAARHLHLQAGEQGTQIPEAVMSRLEQEFLAGFGKAALLAQQVKAHPPSHTTAEDYIRDVADLHSHSDDLLSRGLAVGCLSALGRG
jgi:hypothetical protein